MRHADGAEQGEYLKLCLLLAQFHDEEVFVSHSLAKIVDLHGIMS